MLIKLLKDQIDAFGPLSPNRITNDFRFQDALPGWYIRNDTFNVFVLWKIDEPTGIVTRYRIIVAPVNGKLTYKVVMETTEETDTHEIRVLLRMINRHFRRKAS